MRITIGLAAMASLCLLAGCNRGAANNSANAPAPAANVPEPAVNAAAPVSTANRDNEVRECVSDLSRRTATGTDVGALCGCAVDRITAGAQQNDAVTRCAAEQHVTLSGGEGDQSGPAPDGNSTE
jgi:hypothetical protein